MPVTMKGSPLPASGSWNSEPLARFNKFSTDGGGGSAWTVSDGTLGTFMGETVVNDQFAEGLRDLGPYGVPSSPKRWQSVNQKQFSVRRCPKRMRLGVAGDSLGPGFMQ